MNKLLTTFFCTILVVLMSSQAQASLIFNNPDEIVVVDFDQALFDGTTGDLHVNLDDDTHFLKEIGLLFQDASPNDLLTVVNDSLGSAFTGFMYTSSFLNVGDVIGASSPWIRALMTDFVLADGTNFLGIQGLTSCLTCYGYAEIVYDAQAEEARLAKFTYNRVGNDLLIEGAAVDVPEPGSIALLGLALFGFAYTRRVRQ